MESQSTKIPIFGVKAFTFKGKALFFLIFYSFLALLDYIYCREVILSEDLALNLFELADQWIIPDLRDKCEQFLAHNLTEENHEKLKIFM